MDILIKPLITEKMTGISEKLKKYGFVVHKNANKLQIKKAVESMYDVTVETVNTVRYAGKNKSRNTKSGVVTGKANAFKKAIVTLQEGQTIDFYSNI
jgi:large subunit ribosomal protein L23